MTTYEFRYRDPDASDGERCLRLKGDYIRTTVNGDMTVAVTDSGRIRASAPTSDFIALDRVDDDDDESTGEPERRSFNWTDKRHLSGDGE